MNVLLFTLANAILFRPLPVAGADRLVVIQGRHQLGVRGDFSFPAYMHLREAAHDVFDTTVAYGSAGVTGRAGGGPIEAFRGEYVSGNFFTDLAVPMASGRVLAPEDDRPEAPPALVVSHTFWRKRFGEAALAGQTVLINRTPFTVAGIASPAFFGTEIGRTSDFWIPIGQMFAAEGEDVRSKPTLSWLTLMGRLRPGVTREAARRTRPSPAAAWPPRAVRRRGRIGGGRAARNLAARAPRDAHRSRRGVKRLRNVDRKL